MRLFLAALLLMVGALPASAQWLDWKTPGIPRTSDGKPDLAAPAPHGPDGKPDLTGVWNGPVPDPRFDAANAQPWVNDLVRQRQQEYFKARPYYQCRPSGQEAERFGGWKRILQTPTAIAIFNDDLTYRVIFMDGRQLESNAASSWMGYSVGHWDGDTLVVDSNGFNDKTWAARGGVSHTEALRTTERYRRGDFGDLEIEVTYNDPGAYVKPWGFTTKMRLAADTELLEQVCEWSSDNWTGSLSDSAKTVVSVPTEVLSKYVGVYSGIYQGSKRTVEVSLADGHLIAKAGGGDGEDAGTRTLVPVSPTVFEGVGLGYRFIVDEKGVATDLVEIHVSGDYRYPRQR